MDLTESFNIPFPEVTRPTIVFTASTLVTPKKKYDDDGSNSSGGSFGEGDGGHGKRKRRGYNPSAQSRRSHNETERRRRYRMKKCCETLRKIVPGLEDKTDKAKVLEYTVSYLEHLVKCSQNQCNDYVPSELVTKVNLLQPIRNNTPNRESDSVTYSRTVQIEFVPEQQVDQDEAEQNFGGQNVQEVIVEGQCFERKNVHGPAVEGQYVRVQNVEEIAVEGQYSEEQNAQELAVEGQVIEIHGMDEVKVDPAQIKA